MIFTSGHRFHVYPRNLFLHSGPNLATVEERGEPSGLMRQVRLCAGSARCTYVERKADLLACAQFIYSPESSFHQGHMTHFLSPGLARRDTRRKPEAGAPGSQRAAVRMAFGGAPLSLS